MNLTFYAQFYCGTDLHLALIYLWCLDHKCVRYMCSSKRKKGKGKIQPTAGHEDPEEE